MQTKAIVFEAADSKAKPWTFERREVGDYDVLIEILYTGICHSDIHQVKDEWKSSKFPMVPGHEIVGKATKVGSKVTKFKVGDLCGVGCLVDSCRKCDSCKKHQEQFCKNGFSGTYNSTEQDKKTPTYGGYSTQIVTTESFVIKVSDKFKDLKGVAPLLCAGITTYSPIRRYQSHVGPGKKVGIIGLGGLGHMGVKFAAAMGADVTVISTSANKEQDAKKMGAQHFLISKDPEAMKKQHGTFDFLLDTVSAKHNITDYISLLGVDGVVVVVGVPPEPFVLPAGPLVFKNASVSGSLIGGIAETQEMLDFCAEKQIICDYELINADQIDKAYERTIASDVKYRFVIDIDSIRKQ